MAGGRCLLLLTVLPLLTLLPLFPCLPAPLLRVLTLLHLLGYWGIGGACLRPRRAPLVLRGRRLLASLLQCPTLHVDHLSQVLLHRCRLEGETPLPLAPVWHLCLRLPVVAAAAAAAAALGRS